AWACAAAGWADTAAAGASSRNRASRAGLAMEADMAESPVQRKPGPYHGAWHSSPIDPCRRGAPYTGIPPPHAPRMPIARRLHALAASLLAAASCALAACRAPEPPQTTASAAAENGAISTPAPKVVPTAREVLKGTKWPEVRLGS